MYNNYYGLAFNPFDKQCLSEYVPHNPQGNPRLIDNIMTDAITLGSQMEKKTIDSEVILAAANNQQLTG